VRGVLGAALLVVASTACQGVSCGIDWDDPPGQKTFVAAHKAEAIATINVGCDACDWQTSGREGVMLRVSVDGRYVLHLPVSRQGRAAYPVMLGNVERGEHVVRVDLDRDLTAQALRDSGQVVETISIEQIDESRPEYRALSLAPFVYARPDTVGRFTDAPLFMWYEVDPAREATRYRFSLIFSNEDGGTPTDRLMATWGRTTDIEYLYSVAVAPNGGIVDEDMQGPEHETLKYHGQREGAHALLWVSTENNMVLDRGETQVRYGPAPVAFPLQEVSREAVMDANPWLYDVMARELRREGKIVADAPPGNGTIPDPRRFVYLEGCGSAGDRALAFAIGVATPAAPASLSWFDSDRGMAEYRIVRDGCFRAATPLPPGVKVTDIKAVRVLAHERSGRERRDPARLTRINRLFLLDEQFAPGPSVLSWQGDVRLEPGTPPYEIAVK
jgi:hypothetical protein